MYFFTATASAATWFVDADATGTQSGASWTNAFLDLQPALDIANPLTNDEVWVAAGVYTPTEQTAPEDERSATYLINSDLDGIRIYGGFAGGETQLSQRNPEVHETRIDADIGEDGEPSDNVYHLFMLDSVSSETVIDGFTITNGYADQAGFYYGSGGGVHCGYASATMVRCRFVRNHAASLGGGLYIIGGFDVADPSRIINCAFLGNTSGEAGGGFNNDRALATVVNCLFVGNVTDDDERGGGGFANMEVGATTALINCSFVANEATLGGEMAGAAFFEGNEASPQHRIA